MPRPPRHVREALKAAGEWDFQPSPPPFDPVAAFVAGCELQAPMPGAYDAEIDFSTPPDAYFGNGPIFGDVPEVVEEILNLDLPNPGVFQAMGWSGTELTQNVFSAAHAAAAVQLAVAHESMGFGQSRLSHLTTVEVDFPPVVTLYLESLGEFSGPDERRWLLTDFPSSVDALARSCLQISEGVRFSDVKNKSWLPVRVDDARTSAIIAASLSTYLNDRGFQIPASGLIGDVFSGNIPPAFAAIAQQLPPEEYDSLRVVFQVYSSDRDFLRRFTSSRGYRAIGLLGLEWDNPSLRDLHFRFPTLETITSSLTKWRSLSAMVQGALGTSFRRVVFRRSGDFNQACTLHERPGGMVLSSHYTTTAPSASFRACVGTPIVYTSVPMRMTATGRIHVPSALIPLLRSHFGVD